MLRRLTGPLVILAFTASALAQPLADRVPANAVAYVGWAGSESMGPAYEGSHLKAVLAESNFGELFDRFIPELIQKYGGEAGAGDVGEVMSAVGGPFLRHPSAFFFAGVDWEAKPNPMPRLALLCQAGKDAPAMRKQLDALVKEKFGDQVPFRVSQAGDLVVLSLGFAEKQPVVAGGKTGAKALKSEANFAAALKQVHAESVATLYVDVQGVMRVADGAVEALGGENPELKEQWPRVREVLGLDQVQRMIWTEGFEGKAWGSRAFVAVPRPRKGLLSLLDGEPLSEDALKAIPRTATIAGVGRIDLGAIVRGVRATVVQLSPEGGQQIEQGLKMAREAIGLDVQKDVLDPLGDEWVYYSDPSGGGKGLLGFTVINRLEDPARAEASFVKIHELLNNVLAEQLRESEVRVSFQETKAGDLTIRYLAVPIISPAWAIEGKNLYVGMFPQVVAAAAEQVRAGDGSILDNEAFAAARKELGAEQASSIQFVDLAETAKDSYPGWLMVSRLVGFGDLFGVRSPAMVGPPMRTLLKHLSPAVTVGWSDDAGWHMRSRVPFPGSTLLTSDPMGGFMNSFGQLAPLLQGMSQGMQGMGPAGLGEPGVEGGFGTGRTDAASTRPFAAPRPPAGRQAAAQLSMANLRQMGQGLHMYAADHKGRFPQKLSETLPYAGGNGAIFVNPTGEHALPPGLEGDALAEWVDAESGYAYVLAGGRLARLKDPSGTVLAHEKPTGEREVSVLFADGHVERLPAEDLARKIEEQEPAAAP